MGECTGTKQFLKPSNRAANDPFRQEKSAADPVLLDLPKPAGIDDREAAIGEDDVIGSEEPVGLRERMAGSCVRQKSRFHPEEEDQIAEERQFGAASFRSLPMSGVVNRDAGNVLLEEKRRRRALIMPAER